MKLTELDPQFHRYQTVDGREHIIPVATLAEAQGIQFDCPRCQPYPHGLMVTFEGRGALDHQGSHGSKGQPTRWSVSGSGFDDLTLTPSIDATAGGGCTFHGFITNGQVS